MVALVEPFGIGAFGNATRYWTPGRDATAVLPDLERRRCCATG